jgi:hypothetical protein
MSGSLDFTIKIWNYYTDQMKFILNKTFFDHKDWVKFDICKKN